jgi:hypothetical protein
MAETKQTLREIDNKLYIQVTPRRAQALIQALDIALATNQLDKRIKGIIAAQRELFASAASGQILQHDPSCWVYIVRDRGPQGRELTKIGHARDVVKRFARRTDRLTKLKPLAQWRFNSVAEAMKHEASARSRYKAFAGDGGEEWVDAHVEDVLADLTKAWGNPHG